MREQTAKQDLIVSAECSSYVGRFAPSPTGPFWFFITAVASYCDAKANQGKWLVRIEDTDIPRIIPIAKTISDLALMPFNLNPMLRLFSKKIV
jgi:glutamyl-Q tRNA(Asp) synthetase